VTTQLGVTVSVKNNYVHSNIPNPFWGTKLICSTDSGGQHILHTFPALFQSFYHHPT